MIIGIDPIDVFFAIGAQLCTRPFEDQLSHVKVSKNSLILFGKMDLLLHRNKMSQQSWTKNTWTKCHRLSDKILKWVLSLNVQPVQVFRTQSSIFGWTNNSSTLSRNVTEANCHSRRIFEWMDSVGHKNFYVPQAYILHLLETCRFSKRICFPGRF